MLSHSLRSNQSEGVFPPYSPENFPSPSELRCPHCFGRTEQDRDDEDTRVCRNCRLAYKTYWLKSLWMGAHSGDEWKFNHPEIRAFLHERGLDTFGNPLPDPGDTDEQIANAAERQQRRQEYHEQYERERCERKQRAQREHEAQMEDAWQRSQQLKREEYQQNHPYGHPQEYPQPTSRRPYGAAPFGMLDQEWECRMSQQWGELEKYMEQNVRPMWEQQMAQIPDQMAALIAKTGNLPPVDMLPDDERDIIIDIHGRNEHDSQKKSDRNKTTGKLQAENKRWNMRKYIEIGIAVAILVIAIVCSIVFHMSS